MHDALWQIQQRATPPNVSQLHCNLNELRDLIRELPPNKAAGPDGIPSQILKMLTIQQIVDLSTLFTALANDVDYRTPNRPDIWNHTLAILLPKEHGACTLDRHRAISLNDEPTTETLWKVAPCPDEIHPGPPNR